MRHFLYLFFLVLVCFNLQGQTLENHEDFRKFRGLFDFYYNHKNDRVYLEVARLEEEFLYVHSLSSGIGSNDIGLDRGQLGNEQVVYFKKAGNKLLLVQPNLRFRALTDNVLEKKSVEQAFAKSVLFGFKIEKVRRGRYIIDITDFLLRDAHGVSGRLKQSNQGIYTLDKSKSAMEMDRTKAFPKNVEFDVTLTFKGNPLGAYIRSVVPNPSLVTVNQHHSFIELPDDGYRKRVFDPRCGSYPFLYYDYSTPVQEPIAKRFITRHRLEKKDPDAEISEAVKPIIYYLDNGTPEPIRSALLDGARWWNEAFEALGYKDAFQIKILPNNADPLDIRYNVIQWVHRSTRGWSYGNTVTDPRTGEIIKGHVSLGSLRIRQDFMIAKALMDKPFARSDKNYQQMLDVALERIRQLSAHEVGHTLGFAHNFAASTNNRASVMDYPHPEFSIQNGKIDFSEAYDVGIGEWDKVSVAYSYGEPEAEEGERTYLNRVLEKAKDLGLRYISDSDARPLGGSHALAHLWDSGESPAEELEEVLKIRRLAIENFSIDNIQTNVPNSVLEDVFVPLYFFHRYQTEAVAKLIGGLDYNYAVKGDGQLVVKTIPVEDQRKALNAILKTLNAEEVTIPRSKLELFPPRAMGYGRTRESFKGKTGVTFDALSAPETSADMTLRLLMHPERASRLIQQKSLYPDQLGLSEVMKTLIESTFNKEHSDIYFTEAQRNINYRVLFHIMNMARSNQVHPQVNAIAYNELNNLKLSLSKGSDIHSMEMLRRIESFLKNPEKLRILQVPLIPDGSPIGTDCRH